MGLWSKYIYPKLLDLTLSIPKVEVLRKRVLKDVSGDVLEIGFGTGLNLPHYPEGITKLAVIDNNPGMVQNALKRLKQKHISVEVHTLSAERLPFDTDSFDTVVSTFTLCSIKDIHGALLEVIRVLKPGGKFLFLEHGLSKTPSVRWWQNFLTPVSKTFADGCHLNRDIKSIIEKSGLVIEDLDEFVLYGVPRTNGYIYIGKATTPLPA